MESARDLTAYPIVMRACWWASGADLDILTGRHCSRSEQVRFAEFGMFVLLAASLAFASGFLTAQEVFRHEFAEAVFGIVPWMTSILGALLYALFILNMQRLMIGLAGRRTDRLVWPSLDALRAACILIVGVVFAASITAPLQVRLMERDVASGILLEAQSSALASARLADLERLGRLTSLDLESEIDQSSSSLEQGGFFKKFSLAYQTNTLYSVSLLSAVWMLLVLPPVIRLFADRGPYDFLVYHRNRELLARHGIDPEALSYNAPDGTSLRIDDYHAPRRELESRLSKVRADAEAAKTDQEARHRSGLETYANDGHQAEHGGADDRK